MFSLRLSSLPDFSTVSGGEAGASVIQCRALRCRRLNVNHTGNLGNRWARPPGRRRLVDRWRTRSHKSSQIHRWYTESCAGIMYRAKQTVVDCGTCELSFSPLCPSLPLSLSLTSEPTALFYSCLATDWHVCV